MTPSKHCDYPYHEMYAHLDSPNITCPACDQPRTRRGDIAFAFAIGATISLAIAGMAWVWFGK